MADTSQSKSSHAPQVLRDSEGKATHVVLTIEDYERISQLVEDAEDIREVERRLENPEYVSFDEVKESLGL